MTPVLSFTKTQQLLSADQSVSLSSQQTTELVTHEAKTALSVTTDSGCLCCVRVMQKDVSAPPESSTQHPCPALSRSRRLFSAGMLGMMKFPSRIGKVPPARSGSSLAPGTGSGPCSTAASSQQQVVLWDQAGFAWGCHNCPLTTFPFHTQDTNPSAVPLFLGK